MKGFFERVYALVAEIPPGKVATYGQIAFLLDQPHNARVVGWAMRKPPGELNLPAHRVVNKTGRLSPAYAFGGQEVQRLKSPLSIKITPLVVVMPPAMNHQ